MLILSSTTDKIQVILDGAITTNQLNCIASYKDVTTTTITPSRNILNTNSGTAVDLVGSPGSSTQRIVDFISIFNTDTVAATVTVRFSDNGTYYTLYKTPLLVGESLIYQEGDGWSIISPSGAKKVSLNQGTAPVTGTGLQITVLGSDVTNNNASANTMQDVTGLSFSVVANSLYYFKFMIFYTAAATTTGSRWGVSASAGTAAALTMITEYSLTTTTSTRNGQVVAFDSPSSCNATSAATAANHAVLEGFIIPTAAATFIARFASEVSGSAIIAKAGSFVMFQKLT